MQKLTRQDVPAFIYLIEKIEHKIDNEQEQVVNLFSFISDKSYSDSSLRVSEKTVRRAFRLYENFYSENIEDKHYVKPTERTLNLLASFYNGNDTSLLLNLFKFSTFKKRYQTEITSFYAINKPEKENLDIIFKEAPQKIERLKDYKNELIDLLEELKEGTLEDFIKYLAAESIAKTNQNIDYDTIKHELIEFTERRLKQTEKKYKRVSFLYGIFGSIILFFIPVPRFDDLKSYVINTFIAHHTDLEIEDSDFDDDDFDDDD